MFHRRVGNGGITLWFTKILPFKICAVCKTDCMWLGSCIPWAWYSHICRLAPHWQVGYSIYQSPLVIDSIKNMYEKVDISLGHRHIAIYLFNVHQFMEILFVSLRLEPALSKNLFSNSADSPCIILVYCVNLPKYFLPTVLFVNLPKFFTTNVSHSMVHARNS